MPEHARGRACGAQVQGASLPGETDIAIVPGPMLDPAGRASTSAANGSDGLDATGWPARVRGGPSTPRHAPPSSHSVASRMALVAQNVTARPNRTHAGIGGGEDVTSHAACAELHGNGMGRARRHGTAREAQLETTRAAPKRGG